MYHKDMDFDVVTVGNATVDAFLTLLNAHANCRLNEEKSELCIPYGQKIEVDTSEFLMGGNASNVAVGMSRLGLKASLCAEIGDDELSEKILNTLYREKVDFRLLKRTANTKTSFAVAINFKQERTLFVQHVERQHFFNLSEISPNWLYLTSLGNEWKRPYEDVLKIVEEKKINLAFNPGTLQIAQGGEVLDRVLQKAQIVFLNKEEAEKISNKDPNDEMKELLREVQKLGPKTVVITDGKRGAFAIDEKGSVYTQESIETEVVEKTGAGDSFATGFLAAIIQKKDMQTAMKWGAVNAASVIGKVGAQTGLLTKEEMEKRLLSS